MQNIENVLFIFAASAKKEKKAHPRKREEVKALKIVFIVLVSKPSDADSISWRLSKYLYQVFQ